MHERRRRSARRRLRLRRTGTSGCDELYARYRPASGFEAHRSAVHRMGRAAAPVPFQKYRTTDQSGRAVLAPTIVTGSTCVTRSASPTKGAGSASNRLSQVCSRIRLSATAPLDASTNAATAAQPFCATTASSATYAPCRDSVSHVPQSPLCTSGRSMHVKRNGKIRLRSIVRRRRATTRSASPRRPTARPPLDQYRNRDRARCGSAKPSELPRRLRLAVARDPVVRNEIIGWALGRSLARAGAHCAVRRRRTRQPRCRR